ncbi:coat protein [Sweet potato leaf speckling virus]|uniref:Coat protein n=1 Tax=Sweet potato leaf speckling virus TaxID=391912 RepID=Q0ZA08_9VIRU|nr:coat protein [Sweet potato leaf speckling virus]ABG46339.1 coat protein [Sweet potato leaf speckling virus]
MSTVVVRNNGSRQRTRRRRNQRRSTRGQPVVVVTAPRNTGGRRRRRRGGRTTRRAALPGGRSIRQTFVFSKDNLKGSATGSFTFGPSLSECEPFEGGVLKAFHEYKITNILLQFVSEASSTSSGSISYELDPHCKISSLSSTVNKFSVTKGGARSFTARMINGLEWHDSSEDQCRILYKGNGGNDIAGSFRVTITVAFQNPNR